MQIDSGAEVVDASGVDWGTTGESVPLTRTFTIVNTGTDTLHLDVNSLLLPSGFSLVEGLTPSLNPGKSAVHSAA